MGNCATAATEESVNLPPGFQRITLSGGIRQQGLMYEEPDTESDNSGREEDEDIEQGEHGNSDSELTSFGEEDDIEGDIDQDFFEAVCSL